MVFVLPTKHMGTMGSPFHVVFFLVVMNSYVSLLWLFSLGEKFPKKLIKTFHVGEIFTILLLFLHKSIWV